MLSTRQAVSWAGIAAVVLITVTAGITIRLHSHASTAVPGQSYLICDNPGQFLTSPYTYHSLASGSQSYTVAQYKTLLTGGASLPPLPDYIANESATTTAAIIFAPGSTDINQGQGSFPITPLIYFFEGGAYTHLSLAAMSGDEFIGGSASGFPEPTFDEQGDAGGIDEGGAPYSCLLYTSPSPRDRG